MIIYIVTEKREKYEHDQSHVAQVKFEKICRTPCLIQYYEDVSLKVLRQLGVQAVIFSGYATPLWEHKLESFKGVYEIAREGDMPMIGVCGGHQLIAELWAAHNDKRLTKMTSYPIRKLRKSEADHNAAYHPGYFKEWGFYPVKIVRKDPLFKGLPNPFMVCEFHRCEVKTLPRDFVLLASTRDVRVQAYRHKSRPIYGTQFHCENFSEYYPHGRKVLENFFKIAGILK